MQLNPFLISVAAPVAVKSVQSVVHAAHDVGQGFLKVLTQLGQAGTEAGADSSPKSLGGQLESLAEEFRGWLLDNGIDRPFELQFHLASNGDPIANAVGADSEKIVDLLYSDSNWLDRLTRLATQAQQAAPSLPGQARSRAKLSIDSYESQILQSPLRV